MSFSFLLAAGLIVGIAIAHSWLGEKYLISRLLRIQKLPKLFDGDRFTRQVIRFAWHLTTVSWCGLAAILVLFSGISFGFEIHRAVLHIIATTFVISGLLSLIFTRGRHLSWVVFFAIALISWGSGNFL